MFLNFSSRHSAQWRTPRITEKYGLVVNPIISGTGKYLFQGVRKMEMERTGIWTFRNGKVFLRYKPVWL